MTREEAINIVQSATVWTDEERDALSMLIPELVESEDERIRKKMIEHFKSKTKDTWCNMPVKSILAWLEKQGRCDIDCPQKYQDNIQPNGCIVLENFNGGEGFYKLNLDYLNKKQVEEVEEMVRTWNKESKVSNENIKACVGMCLTDANEQRFKDYNTSLKDCLDYLEKQKEPDYLNKFTKLPHLNSDYEVVDDWAYTPSLCHCDGNWTVCWIHCEDGDVLHECIGDTPVEAIDKAVEWFTSLNKQIPVKKVGAIISSRDKEETACGYLERCLTPDMRKVWYEACDELKKACFQEAEKQKEQKPAEWSEEDEKDMAHIIRILDDCYVYGTHDLSKTDRENLVNKLKSLRPQPKPEWSEEDEACIRNLESIIYYDKKLPNDTRVILGEFLSNLRPQPKKELSIEKAIQWLDDTFYFLDNSSGRGRDCEITTHDFDSLEEMYDSFRKAVIVDSEPHWKPSEEHLEALLNTLHPDDPYYSDLKSLYEQLKKL